MAGPRDEKPTVGETTKAETPQAIERAKHLRPSRKKVVVAIRFRIEPETKKDEGGEEK